MVKSQGHKHHGRGQESNPRSYNSAIKTQIRCTELLGYSFLLGQD